MESIALQKKGLTHPLPGRQPLGLGADDADDHEVSSVAEDLPGGVHIDVEGVRHQLPGREGRRRHLSPRR